MNWTHARELAHFMLRFVAGLLIFQPGASKLFGWFGGPPGGSPPEVGSQMWIGGALEVIGGPLVMMGLLTRLAAFVLSGEMAVAYWQFHFPQGNWPIQNQGAPAALLCFIFLFFAFHGAGAWSLDAALAKYVRPGTGQSCPENR